MDTLTLSLLIFAIIFGIIYIALGYTKHTNMMFWAGFLCITFFCIVVTKGVAKNKAMFSSSTETENILTDLTKPFTTYDHIVRFQQEQFYVIKFEDKYVHSFYVDGDNFHFTTTDNVINARYYLGGCNFPTLFYQALSNFFEGDGWRNDWKVEKVKIYVDVESFSIDY